LTVDNTPVIIAGLQDMFHWLKLNDVPNLFTLIVEVIIGVAIGLTIFGLQSKTDSKMKEVINQIESYTGKKKKLEYTTKKFYVDKIIENLLYIKHQDQRAVGEQVDYNVMSQQH
jgi:hypothetical protein